LRQVDLNGCKTTKKNLRSELVQGIADAIDKGLTNADSVGGKVVIPASFTAGRRYFVMNYQDAMAICRVYAPLTYL